MYNIKYLIPFLIIVTLVFAGCSKGVTTYGKTKILSANKGDKTIQDLIDAWNDYDISYFGLDIRSPLGVMFEPKNNDTTLKGDTWKKITDQKTLLEAVKWLPSTADYEPKLRMMLGPDDQFFGYMYHSHGNIVLKLIDEKTLYVYDLKGSMREDAIIFR